MPITTTTFLLKILEIFIVILVEKYCQCNNGVGLIQFPLVFLGLVNKYQNVFVPDFFIFILMQNFKI